MTTSPDNAHAPVEELSFEAAQAELEAIVERLEDPRTGLDDAIALWERGEALHRHCQAKLDYAAERIQRLQVSAEEVAAVDTEARSDEFPGGEAPSMF